MALTVNPDRLGLATLRRLPVECRPLLRPGTVPAGIVHLGLGAFHRAHQAVHTEAAVGAAGGDWGIIGVGPRSTAVVDSLAAQDALFSVTTLAAAGATTRVVGALAGVRHAASDPAAVVRLLADPAIRVMTLTVTEKAYQLDPVTGALAADPELTADLTTDRPPRTVPGLLVRGLLARAAADAGPIALVSCDNLGSSSGTPTTATRCRWTTRSPTGCARRSPPPGAPRPGWSTRSSRSGRSSPPTWPPTTRSART